MTDQPKFNVLVMGPVSGGKTHSCRTLITENLVDELFILATEPGIETIMGDMPTDRVHWKYIAPAATSWETMIQNAQYVNKWGPEQLQKMNWPNKGEYTQFIEVLKALSNFTCDRTGEEFGQVDEFGPNRALVLDGLSGLSKMAMDIVVGAKPVKTQPEWGIAQDNVRNILDKCCYETKCTFVLLAHVNRNKDEVTGGTYITIDTLGQKLAPDIPKPFDEVIYADRDRGKFKWATERANTDLKDRLLSFDSDLEPNFKLLWDAWAKKKEALKDG